MLISKNTEDRLNEHITLWGIQWFRCFVWQLYHKECGEGGNGSITLQHLDF